MTECVTRPPMNPTTKKRVRTKETKRKQLNHSENVKNKSVNNDDNKKHTTKNKKPKSTTKKNEGKTKKKKKNETVVNVVNNTNDGSSNQAGDLSSKHPVPLTSKRSQYIGPVVRIKKPCGKQSSSFDSSSFQYTVLNKFPSKDTDTKNGLSTNLVSHQTAWTTRYKKTVDRLFGSPSETNVADWKCSLCHQKPWTTSLGDLYGPYYCDFNYSNANTSSFMPPPPISLSHQHNQTTNNKKKAPSKKKSTVKITESPSTFIQPPTEIWIHEDCAVWCPGVYMCSGKLINLEVAIVESSHVQCVHCSLPGASLGCFDRRCPFRSLHYPCARELNFTFDESKYIIYCGNHKPIKSVGISSNVSCSSFHNSKD